MLLKVDQGPVKWETWEEANAALYAYADRFEGDCQEFLNAHTIIEINGSFVLALLPGKSPVEFAR